MIQRCLVLLVVALMCVPARPSLAATPAQTTVVFIGGYGSTLAGARRDFAELQSVLQARDPNLAFAQYSYAGWDAATCAPLDYPETATGQDFEMSKRRLLDTLLTLHTQCGEAQRIVVIGHSLGGLVALHALADNPMGEVTDIVTIDSPLGGAPAIEIQACVETGLCVDGPVSGVLSALHTRWDQTAADNAARVSRLAQASTRVTAWGNQSDCLYAPAVCLPSLGGLLSSYDVRETQWLGVERAERRDYLPQGTLASVLHSHDVMLSRAAGEIAADLLA